MLFLKCTMRFSARRCVQWLLAVVLIHVVVYYWAIKKPRRVLAKVAPHKFLKSAIGEYGTCTFKNCPQVLEDSVNVHLVPHSHIDVGWLKTVDEYYTGENPANVPTVGCVRCTLNSTITELLNDPSRRFIFIEMKYLSRYWHEIDDMQKTNIRKLIKERRLEIVNGGWVMSDAGVTMYNDIIDQHTLGFDFIRETFGPCGQSRTGWHVDQFGHSREHASLFAQMGYDSLFIGRIDFQDLANRKRDKTLEFVWKASPKNLGERSSIFVQTTFDGYYSPPEYVFDTGVLLQADPATLDRMASNFVRIMYERANCFKTNHLLVPMGSDFGYRDASRWFTNIDALIKKINAFPRNVNGRPINMIYSTPSCYTYYVNKALSATQTKSVGVLDTKEDDFHPYGVPPGVYWTGYFTTRGGFKMHVRRAGQILQSCKQLSIFVGLDEFFDRINILRDAIAVMQHHDAITGTQKKLVLQDYNVKLSEAEEQVQTVMSQAYKKVWNTVGTNEDDTYLSDAHFCHSLNISSCEIIENSKEFLTIIYNPLSWSFMMPVRIPVKYSSVTVTSDNKQVIPFQVVPVPEAVKSIPERTSSTDIEVVFNAYIPPLSIITYKVTSEEGGDKPSFQISDMKEFIIENQYLSLSFSGATGKLLSLYNKESQIRESLLQDFAYYVGGQGGPRPSGAYVFVPRDSQPVIIAQNKVEIKIIKGQLVQEVHQKFNSWVSQVVRLYDDAKYAEFQWVVGPLDDQMGREVISRFTTSLNSGDKFYTDSNGREIMQRIRETPGSGNKKVKDYVSGNYYPVTSRIFIRDEQKSTQLTVITDRAQGGSSLSSGSLELMVHRKLLMDDGLGVGEALKDQGIDDKGIIFTGKHYVCLDTVKNSASLVKHLALQTHLMPVTMFMTGINDSRIGITPQQHSFLSAPLPENIQILTLDKVSQADTDLYLLRVEHMFEVDEHPVLSEPASLSLQTLFRPFDIMSAEETTLGGNFRPHEIVRMNWTTLDGNIHLKTASPDYKKNMEPPFLVNLQPMEIRTFRIYVARHRRI